MLPYQGKHPILAGFCLVMLIAFVLLRQPLADRFGLTFLEPPAVESVYPKSFTVPAGQRTQIQLDFGVAMGQFVSAPNGDGRDQLALTIIPNGTDVLLVDVDYEKGQNIAFPDPEEGTISAYEYEFVIRATIVAQPGRHRVRARLQYRPCDRRGCRAATTRTFPIVVVAN
jgi:hypothetical protein